MVKYNEAFPTLFDGIERIEKVTKNDKDEVVSSIVGKPMKILAFAEVSKEEESFVVALIEVEGKQYTTSFSEMFVKKFNLILKNIGEDTEKGEDNEHYFAEPIEAKLVEKQSKKDKNRKYFDLE